MFRKRGGTMITSAFVMAFVFFVKVGDGNMAFITFFFIPSEFEYFITKKKSMLCIK